MGRCADRRTSLGQVVAAAESSRDPSAAAGVDWRDRVMGLLRSWHGSLSAAADGFLYLARAAARATFAAVTTSAAVAVRAHVRRRLTAVGWCLVARCHRISHAVVLPCSRSGAGGP